MTFKKLALVAALATSFSAFAADVTFGALTLSDTSDYTVAAATPELQAELAATSAVFDGNQAYVVQQGNGSLAYISQATEAASYAAIVQGGDGALGLIYQTGALGNKALIVSTGEAGSGNAVASYDVTLADSDTKVIALGKAALVATPVMNAVANVAIINQISDQGFNVAYIDQNVGTATADANFAAIVQNAGTFNNLGMIAQMGTLNKALIVQTN